MTLKIAQFGLLAERIWPAERRALLDRRPRRRKEGGGVCGCRRSGFDARCRMGSKYVPSIKDLKAGQRFQQKQHTQSKFIKPAPKQPAKKGKKP